MRVKSLHNAEETRNTCKTIPSNDLQNCHIKCEQRKSLFTEDNSAILHYIKAMEDNIIDELKNYTPSIEDFKNFRQYIEEISSQLNILANESGFSQKLIEDSALLFESFQTVQQENGNLKRKFELSQQKVELFESEVNELRSQNTALKAELNNQKLKIDEQIEQIKRIENEKNSLTHQLNQNSFATTQIAEQSHQRHRKDVDDLLTSHQEYQKAKDMAVQLTNEVAQLKIVIADLNQEILRQSLLLEKQKDDRYTMSKQLESAFEITEKLKFTIDSNLKSIAHLQDENEKLREELNQNICTIEQRQAAYNARELEMINKTDSLQQSIDEHIRARRISEKSLLDLSVQNQKLSQQNEDLITQLKGEIVRLKSQINSLESSNSIINDMHEDVGHVRSQLEKLLVNITAKEAELSDLRGQNSKLNEQNVAQMNEQRVTETKLSKVIEQCKEMKREYDLLKTNYETLLHDRSALKMKMDQMHRDLIILNGRLESVDSRAHQYAPSAETVTRRTKLIKYRSVPSLNAPDETLQSIQKVRRKIYETRNFWQNGMEEAFK